MNTIRQARSAGAALVTSGAVYFVAEFIAAAAWTDPPYSYTHHFISNLGVHGPITVFDQFIFSPLAWVMNLGFLVSGLAALAGVVLLRGLPGRRRGPLVATALVLAAGMGLVALFPGTGDDGTTDYHGFGALAAFVSGNVLVALLGRAHRLLDVSPGIGRALVVLGTAGPVSLVAFGAVLASDAGVLIGLFERGIIYPFLIGFILLGSALRREPARSAPRSSRAV
ncbi:hypothetical protein Aab01nite_50840 [Paractinoplanes abujensis]|uniref:Putative membrane protein n=1 Tax=Paractinoplanes abujensis TaxID=882441 RepID=A0A7W7G168_9ACTN|nr:DUF998 domain-containing protein [Actinoplanes abujensis]MBB4693848.1 putative membrane protein [Actinoplanes abujensis]GID21494.1 hypothetical protein Aab01nite_50840 [Actinoplanes abujensis]